MKPHRKIAWILCLATTVIMYVFTYAQNPTIEPARILGQFLGAAGGGIAVFLVVYVVGALSAKAKK